MISPLAQRLATRPTTSTKGYPLEIREEEIQKHLTDLKLLAHVNGYSAAGWAVEVLVEYIQDIPSTPNSAAAWDRELALAIAQIERTNAITQQIDAVTGKIEQISSVMPEILKSLILLIDTAAQSQEFQTDPEKLVIIRQARAALVLGQNIPGGL